jgi:hypothetical protein
MSDKPNSSDSNKENEKDNESLKPVSEEEGLKSAENVFKTEGKKTDDSSLDEDEFYKFFFYYLKSRKKLKDLGMDEPSFTTIYQGGNHFANCNVENHGNVVGNDQAIHSNINTGGFSGEVRDKSSDRESAESIESVFDRCEDVKQRSFMIALAALNGCNYRTVVEASQRLQSILQSQAGVKTET